MITADFEKIIEEIIQAVDSLAESMFKEEIAGAEQDAHSFIADSEEKLYFWYMEVKAGQLSLDDVKWLLQSQLQLGEMTALKEAGIDEIQVGAFQSGIAAAFITIISKIV